jgi:acyl carrier protein
MVVIYLKFEKEMENMDIKEKIALLEDMLELDEGTLKAETQLDELEEWDSLAGVSLVALVDEHFSKKVTGQAIKAFKTVQDILNVME